MLKEGALSTLNLPPKSSSSTAKHRPVNRIEKSEEYQLLQEQIPQSIQNTYKSLALKKDWKIE